MKRSEYSLNRKDPSWNLIFKETQEKTVILVIFRLYCRDIVEPNDYKHACYAVNIHENEVTSMFVIIWFDNEFAIESKCEHNYCVFCVYLNIKFQDGCFWSSFYTIFP